MNTNIASVNEGTTGDINNGPTLKSFLRGERLARVHGDRPGKRCLLPKSMVRSQAFMDRFFQQTGWHWLDAVAETRSAAHA
jgi:hypothetical protein